MKLTRLIPVCLIYAISLPVGAIDSHCSAEEQIVFSCSLGKKWVSVCASKNISADSGYIQYRFGLKDSPELVYPPSKDSGGRAAIRANTLMFSGGGGGYMRFINGRYQYIVYTAIGKGWGTKDGVSVEKDAKPIANLKCQDVPVSKMGDAFFKQAGLTADPEEFSLP